MRHRSRFMLPLLIAAAGATVVAVAAATSGASARDFDTISAKGQPISVTAAQAARLQNLGFDGISLLSKGDDRAFYRLKRDGRDCFAVGDAATPGELGIWACSAFPSPRWPVLDLSVVEQVRGSDDVHLVSIQGFASDGVSSIAFTTADGTRLVTAPVSQNVFQAEAPAGAVDKLIAVDASGRVIHSKSYRRN